MSQDRRLGCGLKGIIQENVLMSKYPGGFLSRPSLNIPEDGRTYVIAKTMVSVDTPALWSKEARSALRDNADQIVNLNLRPPE